MKKIIIAILLFFAWKQYYYIEDTPSVGPGIVASGGPYISSADRQTFRIGDYQYFPGSSIQIDGRVIKASRYYFDSMSRISPLDVVLGWDNLSDESVYSLLDFSTSSRSYEWESNRTLIDDTEVKSSTNLYHLIAADEGVTQQLRRIKIGDVLVIQGYLVSVKSAAGLKWQSNSTNSFRGNVAGDIVYVNNLEIIDPYSRLN